MKTRSTKYPTRTPEGVVADRDGLKCRHGAIFYKMDVDFDYCHGEGVILPSTMDDFDTSIEHIRDCCQDLLISRFKMPEWKPGSDHPADAIDNDAHPARIAVRILREIDRLHQLYDRRECGGPGVRCRRKMTAEERMKHLQGKFDALARRTRFPGETMDNSKDCEHTHALVSKKIEPDCPKEKAVPCRCPEDHEIANLGAKIGYMLGKLQTALDLEPEFMVGERVVRGVKKGAESRRAKSGAPPQEERVRIWREALKADAGADKSEGECVSRVARMLAERFGTSEDAERKFYYRCVAKSGRREDA